MEAVITKIERTMDKGRGIGENNPIKINDDNIDRLEYVYKLLLTLIDEKANLTQMSQEDINELKRIITEVFLEKKVDYFIENKFSHYINYINHSFNSVISKDTKNDKDFIKFFYLNHSKHLFTNE